MCKYSDDTGYECPHKRLEDSDYCIFHLQDDTKDADEFNKGIKEILDSEEDLISLHGFYFPPESSDFSGQVFQNKMDFCNVVFPRDVNFGEVKFSGDANFGEATFSGYANFGMATFSGNTNFIGAIFSEYANFRQTKFSGNVNFVVVKLSRYANFEGAEFSGDADFEGAKFSGNTNFGMAEFSGNTNFAVAKFLGNINFKWTEFSGKFIFVPDKSKTINFENTYFSDDIRIKADLSKCSFANSNIERVDMTDSTWIVDNNPKDSYKIWEQRQGELSSNWKELEGIYRRLKQSYQRFGDNDTAGNFYYREMECKRQQLKGAKKLFWDVFYKLLCGYGEKPFNVIWASISIIFAASLFFFYWGIELLGSEVLNLTPRLINYDLSLNFQWVITNFGKVFNDWLECLYTSVITFTTLGYGDVHPIGFSRIVASAEAGIGIIMTALFIFVFTRKMLR